MEGEVDLQGGLDPQGAQQSEPKLDIPPLQIEIPSQTEGVQFKPIFLDPMMTKPTYTNRLSTQPS